MVSNTCRISRIEESSTCLVTAFDKFRSNFMGERQTLRCSGLISDDSTSVYSGFLMTELDVGTIFARIALESDNDDKRTRNRRNARKAYDAILHFLPKIRTQPEHKQINEAFAALKNFFKPWRDLLMATTDKSPPPRCTGASAIALRTIHRARRNISSLA